MDWAIQTEDLSKSFPGGVMGVSGLDMRVRKGSVYGLIGRNGAGKTTALRLLVGLLRPDHGRAELLGVDFRRAGRAVRQQVAYVSQKQQLPAWMTLNELQRYTGRLYGDSDTTLVQKMAADWELPTDRPIGQLSGGEQRQAAVALALAVRPSVLLLDEPAAGLDPIARQRLLSCLVDHLAEGADATVLLCTHAISDLERLADTVGIMDRGRIRLSARLDDLREQIRRIQIVFDGEEVPAGVTVPGVLVQQVRGPVLTAVVRLTFSGQLDELRALPGARLQEFPMTLEEIFVETFGCRPTEPEGMGVMDRLALTGPMDFGDPGPETNRAGGARRELN